MGDRTTVVMDAVREVDIPEAAIPVEAVAVWEVPGEKAMKSGRKCMN
jgi:hypothetical protein